MSVEDSFEPGSERWREYVDTVAAGIRPDSVVGVHTIRGEFFRPWTVLLSTTASNGRDTVRLVEGRRIIIADSSLSTLNVFDVTEGADGTVLKGHSVLLRGVEAMVVNTPDIVIDVGEALGCQIPAGGVLKVVDDLAASSREPIGAIPDFVHDSRAGGEFFLPLRVYEALRTMTEE